MNPAIEPPADRQVFHLGFHPGTDDIDENGHVYNVVYLRWAQDLATAHWRSKAPPVEQTRWAWIALRHEIDYRRPLKLGEIAQGRTWVGEAPDGPRFDRFVRMDGPDGTMCAQARTVWCLIEAATGRPRRVPDWMTACFA